MARVEHETRNERAAPKRTLVRRSSIGGMGNDGMGNYFFVRSWNEADAEVLDFESLFAEKFGLAAGRPGPMFGCSAGPVSDTGVPQPEKPTNPKSKTPIVWQTFDRNLMLPPY